MTIVTLAYSVLLSSDRDIRSQISSIVSNIEASFAELYDQIQFLICIQSNSLALDQDQLDNIASTFTGLKPQILYAGKSGLAISRNVAIDHAIGRYIHFLDSDCRFGRDSVPNYLSYLANSSEDFIFIHSEGISCNTYKSISKTSLAKIVSAWFPRIKFLREAIGKPSYSFLLNSSLISLHALRFNERLGLGAYYHQSEEIDLILSSVKGTSVPTYANLVLPSFTAQSLSHANPSNINRAMQSKGYVLGMHCRRMHPFILLLLAFVFAPKYRKSLLQANRQISRLRALLIVLKQVTIGYNDASAELRQRHERA